MSHITHTHVINDARRLKKQTQDLRALIGETQNQPTEKHAAAISKRKAIYPRLRVNMQRQVNENGVQGGWR